MVSLVIVVVILIGTWDLLRDSVNLALDAVPEGVDLQGSGSIWRACQRWLTSMTCTSGA